MSDLILRRDGTYAEPPGPKRCVNGHVLRYPNVGVGWASCACTDGGGHRTWSCRTCEVVAYRPEHTPAEVFTGRWK